MTSTSRTIARTQDTQGPHTPPAPSGPYKGPPRVNHVDMEKDPAKEIAELEKKSSNWIAQKTGSSAAAQEILDLLIRKAYYNMDWWGMLQRRKEIENELNKGVKSRELRKDHDELMEEIREIQDHVNTLRKEISEHPLYGQIR